MERETIELHIQGYVRRKNGKGHAVFTKEYNFKVSIRDPDAVEKIMDIISEVAKV